MAEKLEAGGKASVKIVVTQADEEQYQDAQDMSADLSHDTTGPIADPDISVQVNLMAANMWLDGCKSWLSIPCLTFL